MRGFLRYVALCAGLLEALSALGPLTRTAGAQGTGTLAAVEAAADGGEVDEARRLLNGWFGGPAASNGDADVDRARFLRARLARDLDSARVDYLWVAIRGDDRYGAAARLRLAQLYVAEGRLDRAGSDLDRLRADFPDSPLLASSWLWTGNVRLAAGDAPGACEAWQRVLALPESERSGSVRRLAAAAAEACGGGPEVVSSSGFAVQLGAFRTRQAARDLRNRVIAAGADARLIEPADPGGLFRVRSGRFSGREEAARHAVRLTEAGFEGIVVPEDQ